MINDCKDELYFPEKRKSISCEIEMITMFKKHNGTKRRKCNMNTHKAIRISYGNSQTNNRLFVTVNTKKHVNGNLMIIYGYHLLINHSQIL